MTQVRLGFASFKDDTFELIVQNVATGKEITLKGPFTADLAEVDQVLPTCVFVEADVTRAAVALDRDGRPLPTRLDGTQSTQAEADEAERAYYYDADGDSDGE